MLEEFTEYLTEQVQRAIYCWGGQGEAATEELIRKKETSSKNAERAIACLKRLAAKGIKEPAMYDCSGLGMAFLQGRIFKSDMSADSMMGKCVQIAKSELKKGDWVFKTDSKGKAYHIGYIVDGELNVVEAQGRDDGVVKRPLKKGGWNRFGRPECFRQEIEADKTLSGILRKGDEGAMVKLLQETLIAKGYALAKYGADGDFGAETEEAVKAFQKASGLVVDGIVGTKTIAALEAKTEKWTCSRSLKLTSPYMRGEDVRALQTALDKLNYAAGEADGIYGKRTESAVRAFQKDKKLTADGIAGKETITVLGGIWK